MSVPIETALPGGVRERLRRGRATRPAARLQPLLAKPSWPVDNRPHAKPFELRTSGGNVLASAATDRQGRVWVAWQSLRGALPDIFCRHYDAATGSWSPEVRVTSDPAGDWEPCLAFDDRAGVWVIFDSSRGNEFSIYAARVGLDGSVGETKPLITTARYEARASAVASGDGTTIWLACERGNTDWGLDSRGHENPAGLNGRRGTVFARREPATRRVKELPAVDPLLAVLPPPPPNTDRPRPRGNSAAAQRKAAARDAARAAVEADSAERAAATNY